MKRLLPFSPSGFLGFAAGCLIAYWLLYQKQGFLAVTIGGAVSGICIGLRGKRFLYALLAALGFALAALPEAFLIGVSMLGLYFNEEPRQLRVSLETMTFFFFGFTIIGAVGALISDPRYAARRVISGIKSFGLVSLCGSIVLESLRFMGHIPKVFPLGVALLTYATAGGIYKGLVLRQDADREEIRLTMLKLND